MKVQLTENIKGDEYKQIKGLFYETDGGILIMEDDFDFSSYGMYASQSLLILENKKSNRAELMHYGKETLSCDKINDAEISEKTKETYSVDIMEGVLFIGTSGKIILKNRIGETWDLAKMKKELEEKTGNTHSNGGLFPNAVFSFGKAGKLDNVRNIILDGTRYSKFIVYPDEFESIPNLKSITIKNFKKDNMWFTNRRDSILQSFYMNKVLWIEPESNNAITKNPIFDNNWESVYWKKGNVDETGKIKNLI